MNRVFIIAEAGVNHNGDLNLAKKLVDAACMAGADAIKFQTFRAEKLVAKYARKAAYQEETTGKEETQYEMIRKLELDIAAHRELIAYCEEKGILFLSTPFDLESIDMLNELGIPIFKIPSGEITNLPYIKRIAKLGRPIILSTGMAALGEIEACLSVIRKYGKAEVTVLHCNTEYPTPMEDVNLRAMQTIKEAFKVRVGYSDHTLGIEVPIAAVAMGAEIIEKHITLDKNMDGPDHKASLDPSELIEMVKGIRNIEAALGKGIKAPSPSEIKNKTVARKSIVAAKDINEGDEFTEDNITAKRPGDGLSPMHWEEVIGRKAKRAFREDELIEI